MRTLLSALLILLLLQPLPAAESRGVVKFGGLPVPGATVVAAQGDRKLSTITNPDGAYLFPDLAEGTWAVEVEMLLFAPAKQEVAVGASTASTEWDLKLLTPEEVTRLSSVAPPEARLAESTPAPVKAAKNAPQTTPTNTRTPFQRTQLNAAKQNAPATPAPNAEQPSDASAGQDPSELRQRAADGLLINGSVNNGAASPFAQLPAFGNFRRGQRSLYNGNLGLIVNNSAFDARSFSLTGQDTLKPSISRLQGLASFGGPLKIPHLLKRNGPQFTVNYQWTRNRNATTTPGLMPTLAERSGDFSASGKTILDPSSGLPFAGGVIPQTRISAQARALLNLFPLPNFTGGTRYNYQLPLVNGFHQDDLQSRLNKQFGRRDQVFGSFAWQSNRTDNTNLFGFLDNGRTTGWNSTANWRHNFNPRFFVNLGYQFNRFAARTTPYFAGRQNISGAAGITGNNQEAVNWGPPTLGFASGITGLSDAQSSLTRNQTSGISYDTFLNRGRHNLTFGGDFRKQQFNLLAQQDPRGTFSFTGAAAGSDLAGFLLGVPDAASIAFGNADKYLRATNADAWIADDWRINPGFTLNIGVRWEYWSPVAERQGRLVNLDIAPGFTAAAPMVAARTDRDLIHPDRNNIAPRVAFSWRPLAASSMVVRGGYGIYYDTSVYLPIAMQMAQQSPLSTSLRVDNTAANPLTLASGFRGSGATTATTFAVDPNFRLGYAHNWQLSVQRDLPWAMQMTATYNGIKGTRAQQQVLPNTVPLGAANPCALCPSGFTYLSSNGNSTRESGQIQVRRRLRSGLTAQVQYTYSKSIDNAALGGRNQGATLIAQNWLDLRAERGLSPFDQRHVLSFSSQYTTGMGLRGGTLWSGWRGALLKEWNIGTQVNAGTGLPLNPIYPAVVRGTGVPNSVRPDYTGALLYDAPAGFYLNPAAYAAPALGQWGNAGRNSITGPGQFTLNATIGRTFQLSDRVSLDARLDASNALNNVTFPSWITTVGSAQFGLPPVANQMRSIQTTLRARF